MAGYILRVVAGIMAIVPGIKIEQGSSVKYSAAAIVLFLAFAMTPLNQLRVATNLAFSDVFYVLAAALAMRTVFLQPKLAAVPLGFFVALSLFLVSGLLSAMLYGVDTGKDISSLLRFLISIIALPLVIGLALGPSRDAIRIAVTGWLIGATISAAYAILNRYGFYPFSFIISSTYFTGRYWGMTQHPNMLGLFSSFAFIVLLYIVLMKDQKTWIRSLALLALTMNAYAINLSGSRAAMGGLLVGAVFALLTWPGKARSKIRVIAGFGLIMLVLSLTNVMSTCEQNHSGEAKCVESAWTRMFSETSSTTRSDEVRAEKFANGLGLFYESPFIGHGYSAIRKAHNIYLQLLASGGVVSILGFLIFLLTLARLYAFNVKNQPPDQFGYYLNFAAATCLITWLASGYFQNFTIERNCYVAAGLIVAIFINSLSRLNPGTEHFAQNPRLART